GLSVIAKRFDLCPLLQLGAGERKSGGRHRDSILADAVEAIAGAILMDTDFGRASEIVSAWFHDDVASLDTSSTRDAKTLLQEWLQGKGYSLPTYSVVSVSGEDHNQQFEVSCHSEVGDLVSYGRASSRKKAEQAAAADLLERLING
ncbi:MAG: ribonuclease III, partial [Proteobacteria bacterium]